MDFFDFMKENDFAYQLVTLKVQQKKKFNELSKMCKLSKDTITTKYYSFLIHLFEQYTLYLEKRIPEFGRYAHQIQDFYRSDIDSIAYLERMYDEDLKDYRNGAPPLIIDMHPDIILYRPLPSEEILRLEQIILTEREENNKSYSYIAQKCHLTKEKTKSIYNLYYCNKIMKAIELIQPTVVLGLYKHIYRHPCGFKKKWELLIQEYPDLVKDL